MNNQGAFFNIGEARDAPGVTMTDGGAQHAIGFAMRRARDIAERKVLRLV